MIKIYQNHKRRQPHGTVPFFAPLFRFFFAPLFFHNGTKNGTVCFCTTVPFYALLFRFFSQQNKKRNSVFLYHCSVFCTTVPFFPQRNKKNGTVCFCTTVPFFALLFRFFHNRTTMEQCVFAPLFRFLHHCSIFALLFHFVSLSRFSP